MFSRNKGNEIWVLLIEKAFAKMNGSYAATIDGRTSDAFQWLTGAPVQYYNHKIIEKNEFWETLKESDGRMYIICANSHVDQINCKKGLISSHSYSVIDAYSLD